MTFFGVDLVILIKTVGYIGIFGIIFAESGLFLGFFFPGDSLLFTAGFLASQGFFNLWALIIISFVAAVLGDSFGYAFGRRIGSALFKKEDSMLFHKDHLESSIKFYEQYGAKTIVLARFMPIVRTFAPIFAGVGKMRYPLFLFFNVIGGLVWSLGIILFGYFLGSVVPNPDRYLFPIIFFIIIFSFLPIVIHFVKKRKQV